MQQGSKSVPGTTFLYFNANFVLAGMIVERVTGQPFAAALQTRIAGPLGLTNTYSPAPGDNQVQGAHVRGYRNWFFFQDVTVYDPQWSSAAGAVVSTTDDLGRFYRALLAGQVISPARLQDMRRTIPADLRSWDAYGLGLTHAPSPVERSGVTAVPSRATSRCRSRWTAAAGDRSWSTPGPPSLGASEATFAAELNVIETALC